MRRDVVGIEPLRHGIVADVRVDGHEGRRQAALHNLAGDGCVAKVRRPGTLDAHVDGESDTDDHQNRDEAEDDNERHA